MRGDASDHLPIALGEKELSGSVLEEEVLFGVKLVAQHAVQGRYPHGVRVINPPKQFNERLAFSVEGDWPDAKGHAWSVKVSSILINNKGQMFEGVRGRCYPAACAAFHKVGGPRGAGAV